MRRDRWVAGMALTAVLALVAVPGTAGSRSPAGDQSVPSTQFRAIVLDGSTVTVAAPMEDPALRSASAMTEDSVLREPAAGQSAVPARASVTQPASKFGSIDLNPWRLDPDVSWYGPGFYGGGTACGYTLTPGLVGVAHRTLPCGTRLLFRNPYNGRSVTAIVVDRGPYTSGRQWDMTGGLCIALDHCFTGAIYWKYVY
ncbi:MAG TPA: septal ring lytic transglycosylase RlpA family protein [Candidatus Dormibacteraeota bacterium]|nr:septal ring lytic transglycosylase RlpA family protein [Candidatus Dormibacteraeota bacterium]